MKKDKSNTPSYARYLVRLTRLFPDFDFFFIKPVRKKAVGLLTLKKGDRVLDAGCGMGGCFPYLVQAVGTTGEIVGVEISPEVAVNTNLRILKNNWKNINVLVSSAQEVKLSGTFDGLLMFAAPDIYASKTAIENLLPHLKYKSRVVFFGAKTSEKRTGIINSFLRFIFSKSSFSTTPKPDSEPWKLLSAYVDNIVVDEYFFGLMFIASGNVSSSAALT
jgi:protein-L-isoaspartate O-methyltransferase